MQNRFVLPSLALATCAALSFAVAQQDEVQIRVVPVAGNVSMLMGQGGNIGLSTGPDGAFLIDDQFAPFTDTILATVATLTDEPVRYLVNTHWHGDHTGGNENMGKKGVVLVAHDNVRVRMSTEQFMETFNNRVPASPEAALPKITFTDTVSFHWNGDTIRAFHVEPAHTDGDVILHFVDANVFHMGDTFFHGNYPFIDTSSGGRIQGVIDAADQVLALCDGDTKIIPGHGELATPDDLRDYRGMLVTARDAIAALMAEGKSAEEIVAAKPTAELDAKWGGGFMAPDMWVGLVHDSLLPR